MYGRKERGGEERCFTPSGCSGEYPSAQINENSIDIGAG